MITDIVDVYYMDWDTTTCTSGFCGETDTTPGTYKLFQIIHPLDSDFIVFLGRDAD